MHIRLPVITAPDSQPPPMAPHLAHDAPRLMDSHGRTVRDLRLSITDRCNFRCTYCMDPDFRYMPKRELLSRAEYVAAARVCVSLGIEKIRITGGEPTLYPELLPLIEELAAMNIRDLAMTTNGSRMTARDAHAWRHAGLTRITLSLDSLQPDRIHSITRSNTTLDSTIRAIHAAHDAGLKPVKVNAVVMRGVNDDELTDFADFAREHEIDMRLIEFMPLDSGRTWDRKRMVTAAEMEQAIGARHDLVRESTDAHDSTSINYRFADGSPGRIGIIASVTRPFCGACSRLRITADGKIRPCLFSHDEFDLREVLRSGAGDEAIARFLVDSMWTKQAGHGIGSDTFRQPERTMSSIGG